MRIGFLVVLLAGAVFYSYIAFENLSFMTRTGRLGPGFFPRLIGGAAIVAILWAILDELRARTPDDDGPSRWTEVGILIGFSIVYAVLLKLFGGFVATVIFLAISLAYLNRGKPVTNAIVAVLVPVAVYLLFDKLLNAGMPPGLFQLI